MSSQYGEWAQGVRDAILSWELVQCLGRVENELLNHQFGETVERKAMYGGSGVLLHCPNGTFNFSNVIVSSGDVQLRWEHIISYAFEFHVSMYIGDGKPFGLVKLEYCSHFMEKGCL